MAARLMPITGHYGHLYDEHGDDVADRLDVLLSQGRPSAEIRALK